jgi:hypothetical protein
MRIIRIIRRIIDFGANSTPGLAYCEYVPHRCATTAKWPSRTVHGQNCALYQALDPLYNACVRPSGTLTEERRRRAKRLSTRNRKVPRRPGILKRCVHVDARDASTSDVT